MASAQVLPNSVASSSSKKQDHLEAGKRRLEEFRKKKAARKPASTSQLQSADVSRNEKLSRESEGLKVLDSDGAASERDGVAVVQSSDAVMSQDSKEINSKTSTDLDFSNVRSAVSPALANNYNAFYKDPVDTFARYPESDALGFPGQEHSHYDWWKEKNNESSSSQGTERTLTYGIGTSDPSALATIHRYKNVDGDIYPFSFQSFHDAPSEENGHSSKEYTVKGPDKSNLLTSTWSEKSASVPVLGKVEYAVTSTPLYTSASYDDSASSSVDLIRPDHSIVRSKDGSMDFNSAKEFEMAGKKLSGASDHHGVVDGAPWQMPEPFQSASSFNFKSSSNQIPQHSTIFDYSGRRSRPSFLDSLNLPRISSLSQLPSTESESSEPFFPSRSSKPNSAEIVTSSSSQQPFTGTDAKESLGDLKIPDFLSTDKLSANTLVSVNYEGEQLGLAVKDDSMQKKHDFSSVQKDEDFAALEQHIEDLTQEKFSLQRALEASRTLAESLAVENSSLTDSFNQQGAVVNQLKSDMERLREEIKDKLAELEALKMEYTNAELECTAADERAKILTSEVIGLEEKALRLRSSELKLGRELENTNAEISSYKRKVSSLEKERRDLQSTIAALQEEKKLLQSKLRKASAGGKIIDAGKASAITKDVSTSTEDLDYSAADRVLNTINNDMQSSSALSDNSSSFPLPPGGRQADLSDALGAIPPDQLRMIGNINSLISELALEKEELLRGLSVESSNNSKLKDLNEELSQKLEIQTQRLELLTAQRMANDSVPARVTDSSNVSDSAVYADEGDEVVERVLGWIMKLFPGGPSKRRTSKLL